MFSPDWVLEKKMKLGSDQRKESFRGGERKPGVKHFADLIACARALDLSHQTACPC